MRRKERAYLADVFAKPIGQRPLPRAVIALSGKSFKRDNAALLLQETGQQAHDTELSMFFALDEMRQMQLAVVRLPPIVITRIVETLNQRQIERELKVKKRTRGDQLALVRLSIIGRSTFAFDECDQRLSRQRSF